MYLQGVASVVNAEHFIVITTVSNAIHFQCRPILNIVSVSLTVNLVDNQLADVNRFQ